MPPVIIKLRKADDSRDVVHRAVQTLAEGKLVVFPTETVYGLAASARRPDGSERIFEAKGRSENTPPRWESRRNGWPAVAGLAPSRWWSGMAKTKDWSGNYRRRCARP